MFPKLLFIPELTVVILFLILVILLIVVSGWAWQQRKIALQWKANSVNLKSMVQQIDCVVIGLSIHYEIQEWNAKAEQVLGWRSQEVLGKNYLDLLINEPFQNSISADYQQVLIEKKSRWLNHSIRTSQGKEYWLEWKASPSLDSQGEIIGLVLSGSPQTNLDLDWRRIISQAPTPIAVLDNQMCYIACSQTWLSQYHLENHAVLGKSLDQVFPELTTNWKTICQQVLQGKSISTFEAGEPLNSNLANPNWVIQPWFINEQEIGGLILVASPITQLIEEREAAIQSAQVKANFLAQMSHEIRTPMNGVLGMVELLLETQLTPQQRDYTSTIYCSAQHLLTVINEILDFSKLEAGETRLEIADFDLDSCIETVVDLLAIKAEEKQLEFIVLIDSNLSRNLQGDAVRIHQILLNLIGNAIKFTEQGSVILEVKMQSENADHVQIQFSVRDTGIGINPQLQPLLFQPFSQASSTTNRQYGGTGLGLSISKHLVHLMGGEIGFDSQVGQGSTFWFNVGFAKAKTENVKILPELEQLKLLVVDQSPLVRQSVRSLAQALGVQVDEANEANQALNAWKMSVEQNQPYPIIMIDLSLLNREGMKLVRALHQQGAKMKTELILMSGMNQRDRAEQVVNLGDFSYLLKPIAPLRFLQSLVLALNLKSSAILNRLQNWQHQTHRIGRFHERDQRFNLRPHALKILLAEDDPVNQKVILSQLKLLGYDADLVNNGQAVLERLTYQKYDLILMDCQMPLLDGYETTQRLRQQPEFSKQPLIIALTASAMASDRERCLEVGMDDYVSKPVELIALDKILQRWANSITGSVQNATAPIITLENLSEPFPVVPFQQPLTSEIINLENPIINLDRLNRLLKGNIQLQQKLLTLFLEQGQTRIQTLRQAIANQDFTSIKQQAHALKGSSASAAVLKMPELAKELENLAQQQTLEGATELVEELQHCLSQVQVFLDEKLILQSS